MEVQNLQTGTGNGAAPPLAELGAGKTESAVAVKPVKAPTQTAAQTERQKEEEHNEVPKVIEGINTVLSKSGSHIRFVQHRQSAKMMVEILDDKTDRVIRTIPDKELLDLAAKIGEMIGVIMDHQT